MISFEDFQKRTDVITGSEADLIRDKYITKFVDIYSDYYKKYITIKELFKDGQFYVGYLWDCLKCPELKTEKQIIDSVELMGGQVIYVLWDLHSSEKILIKDYWKFPKEAVLRIRCDDLLAGLKYLPEDIYLFDKEFIWSLIFTHEYYDDGSRYCLKAKAACS